MIEYVSFDEHRWYTVVIIHYVNGEEDRKVIGTAFAGEGPCLFDSMEEFEEACG